MSMLLKGQLALVTGGSGAIGKAIAAAFMKEGATVIITGRTAATLQQAAEELQQGVVVVSSVVSPTVTPSAGQVVSMVSDVSEESSVVQLFQDIDQQFGRGCDILVNNAGTAAGGPPTELEAAAFERVLRVNVLGPFLCAREALNRMKARRSGRIINIGSISAISPRPNSAPYTTSKFALLGLNHSLSLDAREYGVAVGIVHPGNVKSGLYTPEMIASREQTEGFIRAEDVAACVLTMATLPLSANVLELTVLPTTQPLVGRG